MEDFSAYELARELLARLQNSNCATLDAAQQLMAELLRELSNHTPF